MLADDFSLYLHRPTATDPSLAPDGCDTFYVLSPFPTSLAGRTGTWEAEPYRRKIEAMLERTLLPGLSREVVTSRIATPLDFRDRLSSLHGAGFGLEPLLTQSACSGRTIAAKMSKIFFSSALVRIRRRSAGVLSSARVLDKVAPDASVFA